MHFVNSAESRVPDLLSSAILNFLPIDAIPLVPLLASLYLKVSRSTCSDAPAAIASYFGFS